MLQVGSAVLFSNQAVGLATDLNSSAVLISGRSGRKTVEVNANTTGKFDIQIQNANGGSWQTISSGNAICDTTSGSPASGSVTFEDNGLFARVRVYSIGANAKLLNASLMGVDIR